MAGYLNCSREEVVKDMVMWEVVEMDQEEDDRRKGDGEEGCTGCPKKRVFVP